MLSILLGDIIKNLMSHELLTRCTQVQCKHNRLLILAAIRSSDKVLSISHVINIIMPKHGDDMSLTFNLYQAHLIEISLD